MTCYICKKSTNKIFAFLPYSHTAFVWSNYLSKKATIMSASKKLCIWIFYFVNLIFLIYLLTTHLNNDHYSIGSETKILMCGWHIFFAPHKNKILYTHFSPFHAKFLKLNLSVLFCDPEKCIHKLSTRSVNEGNTL